ncbi:MAG: type II toxin-antitoxin system RelE/ParE family toxin [Acidobacteriota bacterium]|nr:type II toxin-antitoxin system RelE/ParE family toxin [Acidobacteriota bacterium]
MKLIETAKFKKLRKKIKSAHEKEVLKEAIIKIMEEPEAGKLLKGEFRELRSFRYTVKGQSRRLIYKIEKGTLILFSFGPREGIYK